MNDETAMQLKVIVEQVVRPVRAGAARKAHMGRELLTHVVATFEEELARLGDEPAALEQTALRLGNPVELTAQFQQAIPPFERFRALVDRIWSRPGEAWLIRAIRQAALIEFSMFGFLLLPWLFAGAPTRAFRRDILNQVGPDLVAICAAAASFPFLAEWMSRALFGRHGRSWVKVALLTIACGLIFLGLAVWLDGLDIPGILIAMAFGLIWMPVGLACLAHATEQQNRRQREWAGILA